MRPSKEMVILFVQYALTIARRMTRYAYMCVGGWVCAHAHAQSCLALCDSIASSPPGTSLYGIFQVRILECVAIFCQDALNQILENTIYSWTANVQDLKHILFNIYWTN